MKRQPYPVAQMTGGLDVSVDPIFLMDTLSPHVENIWLHKGLIKKGLGWKVFGEESAPDGDETGLPLVGTVRLIDSFPLSTGDIFYLVVTDDYVYQYRPSTNDYLIKNSDTGVTIFTGTEEDNFCSAIGLSAAGAEWFFLTNGVNPIQYWTGGGSDEFESLAGWSTNLKAKQIIYWKNRLIAGGIVDTGTDCPKRIQWSVAGDVTDISGTGSGFFDLVDTSDWIICFVLMGDKLYVLKERSIWELEYVGGTTVFNPVLKVDGVGTYSPHGVVSLDEEMILYGSDNVYMFDGFSLNPVGGQIYGYLYEAQERIINQSVAYKFPSAYIEELKHYKICLASKDKTVPDTLFSYDFDYKAWTRRPREITAIGYYGVGSGSTWAELEDTWADQDWVWRTVNLAPGAPTTLIGDTNGYVYEDDRLTHSTDYMCYDTKDFIFEHAVRWTEFRLRVLGGPFSVKYSTDGGDTWSVEKQFAEVTAWSECVWLLNITSAKIRFRIECEAEDLQIKWLEPWYIPRARSKVLVTS